MFRTCIVNTDTNLVINVVEYETEETGVPPGFEPPLLCVPSDTGEIGGTYLDGVITNPIPILVITAEMNKSYASNLLQQTDWTTIPDVADPSKSNPYLGNVNEFLVYRNKIRAIAINPVPGMLVWDPVPAPVWVTV